MNFLIWNQWAQLWSGYLKSVDHMTKPTVHKMSHRKLPITLRLRPLVKYVCVYIYIYMYVYVYVYIYVYVYQTLVISFLIHHHIWTYIFDIAVIVDLL